MYYGCIIRPVRLNSVIVVIVCVVFVMPAKSTRTTKNEHVLEKSRKRRGGTRNFDDDLTLCNHSIDALVLFMDKTFFSAKYKQTIRQEKYKLPLRCSECERELVVKITNDTSFTTGVIKV